VQKINSSQPRETRNGPNRSPILSRWLRPRTRVRVKNIVLLVLRLSVMKRSSRSSGTPGINPRASRSRQRFLPRLRAKL
jgi:hypothetical protein